MNLSPTEIYRDRKIFLIGSTGFLGKVTLSMLLYRFPNIGKVYITVRARSQEESETRFWNNIITEPPFDPLRDRYGNAFEGFIREKVVVKGGDIAETNLGYREDEAQAIADDIDVVINSAGKVTFNPTLESSLRTNVVGTKNVIAFARRMKRPALVHVSTCFVAGNRSGAIFESDPVLGYFPRKHELGDVEFSVEQEIADCEKLAERVRDEARDAMMVSRFRELARKRLNEEGRDDDDPDALGLAVAPERMDVIASLHRPLAELTTIALTDAFQPLLGAAAAALPNATLTRFVDCRFAGQGYEITVPALGDDPALLGAAFEAAHRARHGHTAGAARGGESVELVNLRVVAERAAPNGSPLGVIRSAGVGITSSGRRMIVTRDGKRVRADVWPLGEQRAGGRQLNGPAILAGPDATGLIEPGWRGIVHSSGAVIVERM